MNFMYSLRIVALGSLVASLAAAGLHAEEQPSRPLQLRQVLAAEASAAVDRHAELAALRRDDPEAPAAFWQSGLVRVEDGWVDYPAAVADRAKSAGFEEYLRRRGDVHSAEGHLQLANWCRRHRMQDRERAHLFAAADLAQEYRRPELLRRMGYVPDDGAWLSPEQQADAEKQVARIGASLKRWATPLAAIARDLDGKGRRRTRGEEKLREITSADAVAAIDLVLGRGSPRQAEYAIAALKRIDGYESSQALARYAVYSDRERLRSLAAEALRDRRWEDFVPPLLRLMASNEYKFFYFTTAPTGRSNATRFPDVYLGYAKRRETDSQVQIATTGLRAQVGFRGWTGIPARDLGGALGDAVRIAERRAYAAMRETVAATQQDDLINRRVSATLSTITGQRRDQPESWWDWWATYADRAKGKKPVYQTYSFDTVKVEVPLIVPPTSCFAAGTPVWTESGLTPIQHVRVGDRVLAKDVETGRLEFKPVLRTTLRPAKPLTRVALGEETIVATGGHQFWVSGEGWARARNLQPGSYVHTARGNVAVGQTEPGPKQATYNLVVADLHTYFVGQAGALVQDLLPPEATDMAVPGLSKFALESPAREQPKDARGR